MQISPVWFTPISFSGSSTSTISMVTPGSGRPQDPRLRTPPYTVWVPAGEVSVMPQPSIILQPVTFSNLSCTSAGSGAPPEAQNFSAERS